MSVTYYVALPFVDSDEGPMPAEAKECLTEPMAIRVAEGTLAQARVCRRASL